MPDGSYKQYFIGFPNRQLRRVTCDSLYHNRILIDTIVTSSFYENI